jgi:cephalosporin hydroxylase
MDPLKTFYDERSRNIAAIRASDRLMDVSNTWIREVSAFKYIFNFDWLGRPIIQSGIDMVAVQEAVWSAKPDLIVETGIAHGGSLIYHASLLALLDVCEALHGENGTRRFQPRRRVVGIDIDIRTHNRSAVEAHPLSPYITMLEGSSVDRTVISQVHDIAGKHARTMVILDSNHTAAHVLAELEAYAPLVAGDSYCIVFDTAIEHMPDGFYPDRPWGKGNGPLTAVRTFLADHPEFAVDEPLDGKLLIGNAPGGFLRRSQS